MTTMFLGAIQKIRDTQGREGGGGARPCHQITQREEEVNQSVT